MTPESAVHLFRQALITAALLCAPLLLLAFFVGVVINLIQIVTSLQDSAFSTIPRLAAFLVGFLLLLPWMANHLITYTTALFGDFARHAR
jgi:flagellar biosynthesis protein FliQ